jgi:hypothetical protein
MTTFNAPETGEVQEQIIELRDEFEERRERALS